MATQTLRERLKQSKRRDFDFGAARDEWERLHALAAEQIARWLPTLPAGVRRYAQAEVYRNLHASGGGPYKTDRIAAAIAEVGSAVGHPVEKLPQAAE
jgi:hypothetical protein